MKNTMGRRLRFNDYTLGALSLKCGKNTMVIFSRTQNNPAPLLSLRCVKFSSPGCSVFTTTNHDINNLMNALQTLVNVQQNFVPHKALSPEKNIWSGRLVSQPRL